MEITSLASSSKGNCYIVNDGKTNLMIEAGISLQQIREKGINPASIDGLLISHEHKDHCKYWYQLAAYTTIYTSKGTFENLDNKDSLNSFKVRTVEVNKSFKLGSYIIYPFRTEHDAKEPFGFYIHSTKTNENLLFATDTYYINNRFDNLNYVMVECNYDREYLEKNPNISKGRKLRTMRSHFEINNVLEFLNANDLSNVRLVYLMHLSNGNSNAETFRKRVEEVTGVPVIICEQ